MSDDLTAERTPAEALRAHGLWQEVILSVLDQEGFEVVPRGELAEARDEIARLNAHVEQLLNACDAADETISMQAAQAERLRALLDAPSTASPVRDGTNTEQDTTTT